MTALPCQPKILDYLLESIFLGILAQSKITSILVSVFCNNLAFIFTNTNKEIRKDN